MKIVSVKRKTKNMGMLICDEGFDTTKESAGYFYSTPIFLIDEKDFEFYINNYCSEVQQDIFYKFKDEDILWKVNNESFIIWNDKKKFSDKLIVAGYTPLICIKDIEEAIEEVDTKDFTGDKKKHVIFDFVDLDYKTNHINNQIGKNIREAFKEYSQEVFENHSRLTKLRLKRELYELLTPETIENKFDKIYKLNFEPETSTKKNNNVDTFTKTQENYIYVGKILNPECKKKIEAWFFGRFFLIDKYFQNYATLRINKAGKNEIKRYFEELRKKINEELKFIDEKIIVLTNNLGNTTKFDIEKLLYQVENNKKEMTIKEKNAEFLSNSIFYLVIPIWREIARATKTEKVAWKDVEAPVDELLPYSSFFKSHDWHKNGRKFKASCIIQFWPIVFKPRSFGGKKEQGRKSTHYMNRKEGTEKTKEEKFLIADVIKEVPSNINKTLSIIWNEGEKSEQNDVNVTNLVTNLQNILSSELAAKTEEVNDYEDLQKIEWQNAKAKRKYLIFPDANHFGWYGVKRLLMKNYFDKILELEKLFTENPRNLLSIHSLVMNKPFYNLSDFMLSVNDNSKAILKKAPGVTGYYKNKDDGTQKVIFEKTDDLVMGWIRSIKQAFNIWDINGIDIEKVLETL